MYFQAQKSLELYTCVYSSIFAAVHTLSVCVVLDVLIVVHYV